MTTDLTALMRNKQEVLAATLGLTQGVGHPVAKGDISESGWREAIAAFLPSRYRVSRGAFIVDSTGEESLEIDIVVHDNYFHPEIFESGDRRLIPRESVYAVFESKPELNASYVAYAAERAISVRALHPTSIGILDARGHITEPRPPLRPLAGILAPQSSWSDPLGESFFASIRADSIDAALDLGVALEHGAFDILYRNEAGEFDLEAFHPQISEPQSSLIFFLSHLSQRLLELGSVPALDLEAYTGILEG